MLSQLGSPITTTSRRLLSSHLRLIAVHPLGVHFGNASPRAAVPVVQNEHHGTKCKPARCWFVRPGSRVAMVPVGHGPGAVAGQVTQIVRPHTTLSLRFTP
jgi:hypothetical protein